KTESGQGSQRWTRRIQQGLHDIDEGLREVEYDGMRLSPRTIHGAMQSIREILRAQAGITCHLSRRSVCKEISGHHERKQRDELDERMIPSEAPKVSGINRNKSEEYAGRLAAERLASVVCAASKKGHVSTLKDLAEHVNLRSGDAFGRNALYYSCLCGHICAAHFVVNHAYGGVEGIPEKERWECRKNALSAEIRCYLDTGIMPDATSSRALKSDEERPAQVPPAGEKFEMLASSTKCSGKGKLPESGERCSGGNDRELHEVGNSACGARSAAPPEEAVLSVASLFDESVDRAKNEDY
ncbi:unnamed protein product, partial [Hapterophycus canaliculatus]